MVSTLTEKYSNLIFITIERKQKGRKERMKKDQ
jgi:hypothetical protein